MGGHTRRAAGTLGLPYDGAGLAPAFCRPGRDVAVGFARACVALGAPAPRLSGEPPAVALGALSSAWRAARRRFGPGVGRLWRFANGLVGGHLLTTNIHPPWSTA